MSADSGPFANPAQPSPPALKTVRHPGTVALLRYFNYGHLPPHLAAVSAPVGELAGQMADLLPDGPELTAGLRKLLESKDCFVRAALDQGAQ